MAHASDYQLTKQLEVIAAKLDYLRAIDKDLSVFGSASHRYFLGPRVKESGLRAIEERLGALLPKEYRCFLAHLGEGGAGPYYGLFTLGGEDSEGLTDPQNTGKPFRWSEAFNPHDWKNPCSQEDVWCDESEEGEARQVVLNIPGALYICHYGCAIRFFLVVNGQCTGEVWRDSQADNLGVLPERGFDGRRVGFLDWYEQWLDGAITQVAASASPRLI